MSGKILLLGLCMSLSSCVAYRNRPSEDGAGSSEQAPLLPFTYEDFEKLKGERTFTSQEELLQLFCELYHKDATRGFRLERPTLARMAKQVRTLFPLSACEEISFRNHRLQMIFRENQAVPVSGTFGQVSVSLSKELAFRVDAVPEDPAALRFQVEAGGLRVNTSWLAKMISPFASDIQASALTYKLDKAGRSSTAGVEQNRSFPREKVVLTRTASETTVDVVDDDLPDPCDLRFRKGECKVFGVLFRLLGEDEVETAGEKSKAPAQFKRLHQIIESALTDPDALFKDGLRQDIIASYNFEEKKTGFQWSFNIP